jgi:hypothetical protein
MYQVPGTEIWKKWEMANGQLIKGPGAIFSTGYTAILWAKATTPGQWEMDEVNPISQYRTKTCRQSDHFVDIGYILLILYILLLIVFTTFKAEATL